MSVMLGCSMISPVPSTGIGYTRAFAGAVEGGGWRRHTTSSWCWFTWSLTARLHSAWVRP
jgi:hypothetical protein